MGCHWDCIKQAVKLEKLAPSQYGDYSSLQDPNDSRCQLTEKTTTHKGAIADAVYLAERKDLSASYGPQELWSVADHWPLFVGVRNLARYIAILDIVKSQMNIPGHFVEFGSWRGANLMFMAKSLEVLDPWSSRQVHCFDNFSGLPTFAPEDGPEENRVGTYKGSYNQLQDMIQLYGFADTVVIHQGPIEETLPKFNEEVQSATWSLVYFDADIYEPAVAVLAHCHERLSKGGVFVFDEWNFKDWPGETLAVREFMKLHGDDYQMEGIKGTRQPSLVLRKIR